MTDGRSRIRVVVVGDALQLPLKVALDGHAEVSAGRPAELAAESLRVVAAERRAERVLDTGLLVQADVRQWLVEGAVEPEQTHDHCGRGQQTARIRAHQTDSSGIVRWS